MPLFGGGARKGGKMTKQAMAQFMKEKLQKTKVGSTAMTGKSASGPASKNFVPPKP